MTSTITQNALIRLQALLIKTVERPCLYEFQTAGSIFLMQYTNELDLSTHSEYFSIMIRRHIVKHLT